jgi:hypothetical protein
MSPPEKETGPCPGPVTHHSTTVTTKIARTPKPGKGFVAKAAVGKVRPGVREPDHTHYGCSCCRWSA